MFVASDIAGLQHESKEIACLSLTVPAVLVQVDRVRSAGMLLKQLCANQSEELKALKGAIPSILKEASDLREQSHKQENAIHMAQRVKVSLEAELATLRERVGSLTNDIKQVYKYHLAVKYELVNNLPKGFGIPKLQKIASISFLRNFSKILVFTEETGNYFLGKE
jgi:hypothetical protein